MAISTTNHWTKKSILTLSNGNLNLTDYEKIVILDDDGGECWCQNEMMQLHLQHNVELILIQCHPFSIWKTVLQRHQIWAAYNQRASSTNRSRAKFYSLIKAEKEKDLQFVAFYGFLLSLHQNASSWNKDYFCTNPLHWFRFVK